MNMFEGGRRISYVLIAIGVATSAIRAADSLAFDVEDAQLLGGWIAFVLAFRFSVGWIVRGFMGIPHGKDSKPE